jgi:hypothetical protein
MAKGTCQLSVAELHEFKNLAQAYETSREALSEFLDDIVGRWEGEIEERSEKWRESEAGGEAQERLEMVTGLRDEIPEAGIDVAQLEGAIV